VAVLSAELVQRLARHGGSEDPMISLYLNVDGREKIRTDDYCAQAEVLIKEALEKHGDEPVALTLKKVSHYISEDFVRGNARGLAVFASGDAFWEVVELPVPVANHLVVNRTPHIRALETIIDEHESVGVLLTDRQRARMMVVRLGQIEQRQELVDPLPRHDDDKGDWTKDHVKAHANVSASHHLRDAAAAMFEIYKTKPFNHLLLCTTEELKPDVERQLHGYLKSRVVGRSSLPVNATDDEVMAAAFEFSQKEERKQEQNYVDRLRAGVAANTAAGRMNGDSIGAVAGLDHTLKAVFEKRVETLLVSEGYATEGWRCEACSYIAAMGRHCKICEGEMTLVDDVVEEAVEDALRQNCRVEFCSENADLDVMGRIGALLRF